MNFKIYHNPRCSKSRQTLALMQEKGVDPEIVLYLVNPPSRDELAKVVELLGVRPVEIARLKDADMDLREMSDDEVLDALAENPKWIERPIVIRDGVAAVVGRPPENVLKLMVS